MYRMFLLLTKITLKYCYRSIVQMTIWLCCFDSTKNEIIDFEGNVVKGNDL